MMKSYNEVRKNKWLFKILGRVRENKRAENAGEH